MANPVIGIDVEARLDKLRAQLSTLGPGMEKEAKAMTAALEKQIKAQAAAMKRGAKETDAAGNAATKAAKAFGPLGGILSRLSPEAGAASSSIAALTGTVEGLAPAAEAMGISVGAAGPIVAGLTAVVGAGYLAWQTYTEEERRNKEITDALKPAVEALTAAHAAERDALIDLRVAQGDLTTAEAAAEKQHYATQAAVSAALKTSTDKIAENNAALGSWGTHIADVVQKYQALSPIIAGAGFLLDGVTDTTSELVAANAELSAGQTDAAGGFRATAQGAEDARAEIEKLTKGHKAADEAAKAAADHEKEIEAAHEVIMSRRRESDKHLAEAAEAARKADEAAAKEGAKLIEDRIAQIAKEEAAVESLAEAERQAQVERLGLAQTTTDAIARLGDQLLSQQIAGMDTSTEAGKQAAMQAWEAQQALALAVAGTQAALGVAVAAASLPPPANAIPIAAAVVTGLANVASVAAAAPPKFHMGTSEVPAILESGEAVLTRRGAQSIGRDTIAAANSGRLTAPRSASPSIVQYRHQEFNRFIRDNLLMDGPLSRALQTSIKVGHRTDRG